MLFVLPVFWLERGESYQYVEMKEENVLCTALQPEGDDVWFSTVTRCIVSLQHIYLTCDPHV